MKGCTASGCLIAAVGVWLILSTAVIAAIALLGAQPNTRAVLLMGASLVLVWIVLAGSLQRLLRDPARAFLHKVRLDARIKFVALATALALAEEAVTTTLTNLAPLFGVPYGSAYITASGNYFDVVCLHSVVVFVPMFLGWALLLQRYDFSPNAVFLLFGLTGLSAEISFSGTQAFLQFGLWIFVYGLMVWLPAHAFPAERGARKPPWWMYPAAVLIPVLFAIPVAVVVGSLHPVRIHFPEIPPNSQAFPNP
ncbi:MAG: hypothetical protein JW748_00545 [Anaerolineales bacterium]|nr:hypothetical protein [Anaerolineales bacterium]